MSSFYLFVTKELIKTIFFFHFFDSNHKIVYLFIIFLKTIKNYQHAKLDL